MSVTKIGAIYAINSKLLQRIYIPHADDAEIGRQHVGSGEVIMEVPIEVFRTGGEKAVQDAVGLPTFSGRCVVVDHTNTVIDVIVADPEIYSDPRGKILAHDYAKHGDVIDPTILSKVTA